MKKSHIMTVEEANSILDDGRPEMVETTSDMFSHIDMLVSDYVLHDDEWLTKDARDLKYATLTKIRDWYEQTKDVISFECV